MPPRIRNIRKRSIPSLDIAEQEMLRKSVLRRFSSLWESRLKDKVSKLKQSFPSFTIEEENADFEALLRQQRHLQCLQSVHELEGDSPTFERFCGALSFLCGIHDGSALHLDALSAKIGIHDGSARHETLALLGELFEKEFTAVAPLLPQDTCLDSVLNNRRGESLGLISVFQILADRAGLTSEDFSFFASKSDGMGIAIPQLDCYYTFPIGSPSIAKHSFGSLPGASLLSVSSRDCARSLTTHLVWLFSQEGDIERARLLSTVLAQFKNKNFPSKE